MSGSEKRRALRDEVFAREGGQCFYCDRQVFVREWVWPQTHSDDDATMDHIIPRSDGGVTSIENLVLACRSCNEDRSSAPADEYLLERAG